MNNHLYDIFKERWDSDIYIISDTHFSDEQSYRFRFPEKFIGITENSEKSLKIVSELDLWQIKLINKTCGKASILVHIGDLGNIECVKKLRAKYKVLILGNHDVGASNYKRVITKENKKYFDWFTGCDCCEEVIKDNKLFDEVYEGPVMINDRVILSHEPMQVPEYMFNIHGHVHDKNNKGDNHHLNVCAEAIDYTPVNLLKSIKDGLLKDIPNIHRPTIDKATAKKAKKSNN